MSDSFSGAVRRTPDAGELLVALNGATELPRSSACRLAALRNRWLDERTWPLLPSDLGVPAAHVRAAAALAAGARSAAESEHRRAAAYGARVVSAVDEEYPARIRELGLPPPALSLRGILPGGPTIAIVGARRASREGLEVARWFGKALAERGVTIVSGFAIGIDAAAHHAALETEAGRTVAVLGCGLGIDYPKGHRRLGDEIAERGALLTEFPCDRPPARWQFPARNRLIAALADACLVIEAGPNSGSLVTARWALDLGRDVLAVPGRVFDELALGTNRLIADGARPALEPADALEAIGLVAERGLGRPGIAEPPAGLNGEKRALWLLAREHRESAEALAARASIPIERTLSLLLELELAGHLRRAPGGAYEPLG